jgi:hypothetical protein
MEDYALTTRYCHPLPDARLAVAELGRTQKEVAMKIYRGWKDVPALAGLTRRERLLDKDSGAGQYRGDARDWFDQIDPG